MSRFCNEMSHFGKMVWQKLKTQKCHEIMSETKICHEMSRFEKRLCLGDLQSYTVLLWIRTFLF